MNPPPEISAAAASDAYLDQQRRNRDKPKDVNLAGHPYKVYAYTADAATGFHATAYQNTRAPHGIIIAYRGTDTDFVHHARTGAQDIGVDVEMVKDQTNRQKHAAHVFTDEVLAKAARDGIPKESISLAGHSLGGVFVEIEAHRHGLSGVTVNGYGAVDLNYGVPEGGDRVVNYRMASDMVSAGSRHSGQVITLADDNDIRALTAGRYLNAASGSPPPNPLLVIADNPGAHGRAHFAPEPGKHQVSVLSPELLAGYQQNYENNKAGIDHFRDDVHRERTQLVAETAGINVRSECRRSVGHEDESMKVRHLAAAAALTAGTLAGCSDPDHPSRNAHPTQRYELTITADAPGVWDSVKASVSYEVTDDACTPEAPVFIGGHLGGPLGQEVEIEVSQVGENTWRGYFYRDLLHDEDYYGRGVCHWDAVGAGATFFTTAKNKFGAGASLEFPRVGLQTRYVTPRTRYFKKRDFLDRSLQPYAVRDFSAIDPIVEQSDEFFPITVTVKEDRP
ncbi:hypothetical protein [Dyella japonica]|uniref:Lipase (Class 3) n=1 Tax=Dyella japonica TaxID=231455 RepID=A0ABV2JSR1_9GAMM